MSLRVAAAMQELWGSRRFDPLQPIGGTPAKRAVVVQVPPGQAVGHFRTPDHPEYGSVLQRFHLAMCETGARTEAKAGSFGVSHPDVVSDSDGIGNSLNGARPLDRLKQGGIQASGEKELLAEGTESDGCFRRRVEVPLHASAAEVLCDHAWSKGEFAYGRAKDISTAVIQEGREEAETDVVARFGEMLAEPVSNQRVRYGGGSRCAMAEQLPQGTDLYFARAPTSAEAFHSTTAEVLHQLTVLFERFGNRWSPCLKTTLGLKNAQERLGDIVARLGEVLDIRFLCFTRNVAHHEQACNNTANDRQSDLLHLIELAERRNATRF